MFALHPSLAFLDVGGPEILVILVVALLLFGSQRLPELARTFGKSLREFKKAASGLEEELKRAIESPPPPPQPRAPATPSGTDTSPKDATQALPDPPSQPPEEHHQL